MVRTPRFQCGNTGSIPVEATIKFIINFLFMPQTEAQMTPEIMSLQEKISSALGELERQARRLSIKSDDPLEVTMMPSHRVSEEDLAHNRELRLAREEILKLIESYFHSDGDQITSQDRTLIAQIIEKSKLLNFDTSQLESLLQ